MWTQVSKGTDSRQCSGQFLRADGYLISYLRYAAENQPLGPSAHFVLNESRVESVSGFLSSYCLLRGGLIVLWVFNTNEGNWLCRMCCSVSAP